MNTLNINIGKDCEEIILDYVAQLEHFEKQEKLNWEIQSFIWKEYDYKNWCKAWETNGKVKYYWA